MSRRVQAAIAILFILLVFILLVEVLADLGHRTWHGTVFLLGPVGMLAVAVWSKSKGDSDVVGYD
jgi:hypothetical protein